MGLALLSHNLGNGEKLVAQLQGQAEAALEADPRFSDVNLTFERAPLTRVALMTGPLEGEDRVAAMALVRKTPGVSGVRWADAKTVAHNLKGASFPITNHKTEEDLAVERRLAASTASNATAADKALEDHNAKPPEEIISAPPEPPKAKTPPAIKAHKPNIVKLADDKAVTSPAAPANAYAVTTPSPAPAAPAAAGVAAAPLSECQKRVDILMGGDAVSFRSGSPWVNAQVRKKLSALVQELNRCGTVNLTITGHADNRGPASINRSLSQARADAVRDILVAKGFAASRITTKGLGGSASGRTISFTATPVHSPAKGGN